MSTQQVYETLKSGTPSIVSNVVHKDGEDQLSVGVVLLKHEQVAIVAERLKEILQHTV